MGTTIFHFLLMYTTIGLVNQMSCHIMHNLSIEQLTVSRIDFLPGTRTRRLLSFTSEEERQKLCLYAKIEANLRYLDYNDVPDWYEVEVDPPLGQFRYGIRCATLPTVYVLQELCTPDLRIVFVQSLVTHFIFDPVITTADFVSFSEELQVGTPFSELTFEDCKNLCGMAGGRINVYFLDRKTIGAQKYKFSWKDGISEIDVAVPCPTLPPVYLRLSESNSESVVNLVLLRSFIDDYNFRVEENKLISARTEVVQAAALESRFSKLNFKERLNLCTIARRYHYPGPFVAFADDASVSEAQTYSFQYSNGAVERGVAILCPALPQMYLREEKSEVRLNFLETLADRCTYSVKAIACIYLNSPVEGKRKYWELTQVQEHPFTLLSREDQWNLCFGAQKYILEERPVVFAFAMKQNVFKDLQLILGPKYMSSAQLEDFKHHEHSKLDADVFIQCSKWPTVYLRSGRSNNEIEVVLLHNELSN